MQFGQPTPRRSDYPASWDLVISDLREGIDPKTPLGDIYMEIIELTSKIILLKELEKGNTDITIEGTFPIIHALAEQRDKFGLEKYNTRLQPFNGRDAIADCVEEVLDLLVYFRTKMFEISYNRKPT